MAGVSPSKREDDAKTVSHLCGAERSHCFRPSHLWLELKKVNEERCHCHFVMNHLICQGKAKGVDPRAYLEEHWNPEVFCPHLPHCGEAMQFDDLK
jgi:Zinc-binding loop region of homing endonuclease